MSRRPIKNAIRTIVVGAAWAILVLVGFLAKEYQDDIVLSAFIIAGASGVAVLVGRLLADD